MSMMVSFVLSFFPRDVLDEILNLIESVSEDFPSYSCLLFGHPGFNWWFSFAPGFQWCCLTTKGSSSVTIHCFYRVHISDSS